LRVGMTLPVMEPGLDAATLETWSRTVDDGPFASLCFGERMAFDNPETMTLLGAVAAWTRRVRLVTTVVVPQLHHPVLLAKSLATADLLCGGRLTVGLGVGGREEDYRAVDADPATQTIAGLAEAAAAMRRVWEGKPVSDEVGSVGPPPVQEGGPELLVGTMGPRTIRAAAAWADGLAGFSLDLDPDAAAGLFSLARDAWRDADRDPPRLATSFWFALDDDPAAARHQVHRHLRHYMSWLPPDLVDAMAPTTGFAGGAAQLRELLDAMAEAGADEVHLVPTSDDLRQVEQVAELLG